MNSTTNSDKVETSLKPSNHAARLKLVRAWHLYLGSIFAPSIIFFALTGAIQLFGLHEGHPGEAYQPPTWVQKLGSIHKNQTVSERRGPPPGFAGEQKRQPGSAEGRRPAQPEGGRRNEEPSSNKLTLVLKCYFLAMAVGLVSSTLLGIYLAFEYNRSRTLVWTLLLLGTAIPVVLLVLMT